MNDTLKKVFRTAPSLVRTSRPTTATTATKPVRPNEDTDAFLERAAAMRDSV
ncbi:hypothetical protein [Streptomyces sp. TE33382]